MTTGSICNTVLGLLRRGLELQDGLSSVSCISSIYDVAFKQGVAAIVFDGLMRLVQEGRFSPSQSDAFFLTWQEDASNSELSYIVQQKTSADLALIFASGNIRTYVLKGVIIAECYPDPTRRSSCDMDCFLLPEKGRVFDAWEKGNSLIEERGYPVNRSYYKNSTITLPGLSVENHKFLTPFRGNSQLKKLEWLLQGLIRSDDGNNRIDGTELYRPPVLASALFLVEHAYSHFLHEGLNLRLITDWMMFHRFHMSDIDWPLFDKYIDEYGLRRFYDAYVHVGEYVLGEMPYSELSSNEQRMMDSVWEGLDLHDTVKGVRGKLNLVGNTLRASWKYRYFSPISMIRALWIQVKGFLFIKNPSLGKG